MIYKGSAHRREIFIAHYRLLLVMKIDYMTNPLAIVKKFDIHYGTKDEPKVLEGIIRGVMEEGFDEVTWYEVRVQYRMAEVARCEIGGWDINWDLAPKWLMKYRSDPIHDYQNVRRGTANQEDAEKMLKNWCKRMELPITEHKKAA